MITTVEEISQQVLNLNVDIEDVRKSLIKIRDHGDNWMSGIEKDERISVKVLLEKYNELTYQLTDLMNTKIQVI